MTRMIEALLAQHAPDDIVAFGQADSRVARELLCDVARVAACLPEPAAGSHVLLAIREDRYAFAVAMLAAWLRGHAVALAPLDVSREDFLQLAVRGEMSAVLHDTFSSAALRIDRLLAEAPQLAAAELSGLAAHDLGVTFHRGGASLHVCRSELLAEARRLGLGLALPQRARVLASVSPEMRYGLAAGVLWPLLSGGQLQRELLRPGTAAAGDVLVSVPAQLRALVRAEPALFGARTLLSGGAALSPLMAAELPAGVVLHEVFASTQAGCVGARPAGSGAAFRALPGATLESTPEPWPEQLEEQLAWLPGVDDAAVLAVGECVRVALVAPGAGESVLRARVTELLAQRAQLAEFRVLPEASRALRRGGSGRHDRTRLLRFFDLGRDAKPLSFELEARGEAEPLRYQLHVPANYAYFEGHFPGYPILPGAAQLSEMVLPCVRRARPGLGRLLRMARLKFQERIKPDELIDVSLTFAQDPTQVDFTLRRGATVCAAGRLVFAPGADGGNA
jgi:hypothetical protein